MKRFMLVFILFLVGCPPPLSYNERIDNTLQDTDALDPGWAKLTHPDGNNYRLFRCKTPGDGLSSQALREILPIYLMQSMNGLNRR